MIRVEKKKQKMSKYTKKMASSAACGRWGSVVYKRQVSLSKIRRKERAKGEKEGEHKD